MASVRKYSMVTPKRKRSSNNQKSPVTPMSKFIKMMSKTATTTPVHHDASNTTPHQVAGNSPDVDALEAAMAKCFTRPSVKEAFQKEILGQLTERVDNHDKQLAELKSENTELRSEIEDLKQYTRRNALVVTNQMWKETQHEDTDNLIIDLAEEFGVKINRSD